MSGVYVSRSVLLNGFRHHYDCWLPEVVRLPPLIALHGFGTTGYRTFRYISRQMVEAGIPLYALDLLGFGHSDQPEGVYSLQQYAGLTAAFAARLELEQAVLLGHSMGGKIAAATAALFPQHFSGLILANSGGFTPLSRLLPLFAGAGWVLRLFEQEWFYRFVLPRTPLGPVFQDDEARVQLLRLRRSHRALDLDATGIRPRLAAMPQPALVLWGEDDPILPRRTAFRIQRDIPTAALHFIPHAGHAPMKDRPDAFAAAVAAFVRSLALS